MTSVANRAMGGLLALLLAAAPAAGTPAKRPADDDPRVAWLREHALRLRSIDPEDGGGGDADLAPLRAVLEGVRVVLLGEQSHGDGATFLAKARLIRYLHRELGFDVLAFESGLYDCRKAWQRLRAGEDAHTAFGRGVFAIWTRSAQLAPLIDYLGAAAAGERPLELAGFDSQMTGSAAADFLLADLDSFLRGLGSSALERDDWPSNAALLQALTGFDFETGERAIPPPEVRRRFDAWLAGLAAEARAAEGAEAAFWAQLLRSLRRETENVWLQHGAGDGKSASRAAAVARRDRQMAENLLWLAREAYPERKIIVWAATFHAARGIDRIETSSTELRDFYRGLEVMGDAVHRALGARAYTLGFTAYQGSAGSVFGEPKPLSVPTTGSLEDLMARAGLDHAIVDFRALPKSGRWLRRPMIARPLGYTEMRARWPRVVDGMFFIRTMTPSTRIGSPPRAGPGPQGSARNGSTTPTPPKSWPCCRSSVSR